MSYINKYGGVRSRQCNEIAREIWQWCESRDIILFASYISTIDNFLADELSRMALDNSDFSLSQKSYNLICKEFGVPQFDYFATNLSTKCDKFYSWYPCEGCQGVDAFSQKWTYFFFAFPPFSLVGRVFKKIVSDDATGIVVIPKWEAQPWFSLFLKLCKNNYIELPPSNDLMVYLHINRPHELSLKTTLLAAKVSKKNFHNLNQM